MANRFVLNTISYHGSGAIKEIPGELQRRGYKKIFVCSDPDLVKFGVTAKVTDELDAAGIAWSLYSEIKPNPTIQNVKDGVEAFKVAEADAIVTIGGGSSMDTAKAIGIIINNPEFADVRSLEGVAPTKNHAVFTIAVPTTAGTAAEVTINYVITDPEKVRKFVCVDTNDAPEVAVVDPDMMASMPAGLTASTGMDALTHAIEGYTTKGAWELSDMFHFEAIKLISENLRDSVAEAKSGQPGSGREGMALGQYVAGMGFSNVGLGIDHAMAHTLSAHYDTPHGVACAMLLPIAMEFNKPVCAERLAKAVVGSPLVKAAMFGADANWGRVLCAMGYSKAPFRPEYVDISFSSAVGAVAVCRGGMGLDFDEEAARSILSQDEVVIDVHLHEGEHEATCWGCDLTYEYVKINGDYRT